MVNWLVEGFGKTEIDSSTFAYLIPTQDLKTSLYLACVAVKLPPTTFPETSK